jgi:glycosyltransferase involved in cell wall biosynthesis
MNGAHAAAPRVSVIMTTYNGARLIGQSIDSLLAQTFRDFELIVVDDCSTDATPQVLRGYRDPRLRVVPTPRNLGVVGSRNFGFARAAGDYVATLDHDDLSRPTRLARQVDFLDRHPGVVLVGTGSHDYEHGTLRPVPGPPVGSPPVGSPQVGSPPAGPPDPDPLFVQWRLQLGNPLVYSSIMFRAAAARRLDVFMREERVYADDFDLYHRLLGHGRIAQIEAPLTIYRRHPGNTFRQREQEMQGNAARVLAAAYAPWFGAQAAEAASLVVRIVATGEVVRDDAQLRQLAAVLDRLRRGFLDSARPDADVALRIDLHCRDILRRATGRRVRAGGLASLRYLWPGQGPGAAAGGLAGWLAAAGTAAVGALPGKKLLRAAWHGLADGAAGERLVRPPTVSLLGATYAATDFEIARPPTLYVVVDTEAEFDWDRPFAHDLTQVTAMSRVERAQAIFDRHGLRPVYVVDYPVAAQPQGYQPLRAILERGGCEIGAHLHPWTTPPFEEMPSEANSYPGNLPAALEVRKLAALVRMIRQNLGVTPRFYKAGRYGVGSATMRAIAGQGLMVDFSLLPGADLRRRGGPDFRAMTAAPYRVAEAGVLSVPMTRAHIGLLAGCARWLAPALRTRVPRMLKLPQILSHLRLLDAVTLTPEGITAPEQIQLLRSLLARGHRVFVLHYHSPSLIPGNTPYVRTEAEAQLVLDRLDQVLRFFLDTVGGLPGNPRDLLPAALRGLAPDPVVGDVVSEPGRGAAAPPPAAALAAVAPP